MRQKLYRLLDLAFWLVPLGTVLFTDSAVMADSESGRIQMKVRAISVCLVRASQSLVGWAPPTERNERCDDSKPPENANRA